jgi:hypothetical protein
MAFEETTKQLLIRRMLTQRIEEHNTETVKLDNYEDKPPSAHSDCC